MISIIVAISDNYAIGRGGDMPWHLSEDLKYFKRITTGHSVIMGSRTFKSLGCKPLPNRRNIVVSRSMAPVEGIEVFNSLESAIAATENEEETFVMGGGEVYRQAIEFAAKLYITRVYTSVEDADTFFPQFSENFWKEISRSEMMKDSKTGYEFQFVVYQKII